MLSQVPSSPGAYAIRCVTAYPRRIGSSDILYFGSATNQQGLKNRLRQYFHPGQTQRTNLRILGLIGNCSDFEVSVAATESIPKAKFLEATLLEQYEAEHGELPPENKRR
jgi:excinuclease UvrABC nuclease subunit